MGWILGAFAVLVTGWWIGRTVISARLAIARLIEPLSNNSGVSPGIGGTLLPAGALVALFPLPGSNQGHRRAAFMTTTVSVDRRSAVPVYEQIRSRIAGFIGSGALTPSERMPSVRALAADLGVAVNTVARVHTELEAAGLVHTRRRTGTVVAELTTPPIPTQVHEAARTYIGVGRAAGLDEDSVPEIVRSAFRQLATGPTP